MTPKIFALCLVFALIATVASAQDTIKSSSVPKAVASQISKSAAKKAVWTKTPTSYTAEYDGNFIRYDNDGNTVWTSKKIERQDVDSEIMCAYVGKYGTDYPFQWAEEVTLANGEKRTFIIGKKGNFNYYFKYNDKKLMVEKTATCK
jgi:hypothetical protein